MPNRTKIFIGHHKDDEDEKRRVYTHIAPYEKLGLLKFWCTGDILPGEDVSEAIDKALLDVKIAITLISIDFINEELDSQRVTNVIKNHQNAGLEILPILIRPCNWDVVDWIKVNEANMIPKSGKALSLYKKSKVEALLADFAKVIRSKVD